MESSMPRCIWPEWEFVKQIGRGSYGTVYEAVRCDEFGVESRAAIKVISIPQNEAELDTLRTEGLDYDASRTYMRKVVDAFVNEIKLMIAFKGVRNIVSVDDYKVVERENEIGWDISIRMELLTSLASYIADNVMTEQEAARMGCDICSALEACEKENVIHRDIKPGNIFINDFGDFKLGDFGIARQMESMTTELSRKGTGSYMAPEVERGVPYNDSVDLYSLGLVLYFLMNNKRGPFLDPNKQILTPGEREAAIRRRLDGESLPPPCNASVEMTRIIQCACAYDPRRRFNSAQAMRAALQSILNEPYYSAKNVHVGAFPPQMPPVKRPDSAASGDGPAPAGPGYGTAPGGDGNAAAPRENTSGQRPEADGRAAVKRTWLIVVIVIAAAIVCAGIVFYFVQKTRTDKYNSLVEQQVKYRDSGSTAEEEQAWREASELLPSALESYYQHARTLHEEPSDSGEPDYLGCINFIEDNILENSSFDLNDSRMADVYYLYADSLYQTGEYADAVDAYRDLFSIGTDQPLYYRDYAIALACTGYYTRAEDMLAEAERLGLGEDSYYYTEGEIKKAAGEYSDALEDFRYCIRLSRDEELISRAYLASAEIYSEQGELEMERSVLIDAADYDTSWLPQVLQELIRADINLADASADSAWDASYYRREAIGNLNLVISKGWGTFTTYNNLVLLYEQEGDLTEAEEILNSVKDSYENDYRWYKRYAFLEVEKQEQRSNADRDYSAFKDYYFRARDLYALYMTNGGNKDSEMGVLESQYQDVMDRGWLN